MKTHSVKQHQKSYASVVEGNVEGNFAHKSRHSIWESFKANCTECIRSFYQNSESYFSMDVKNYLFPVNKSIEHDGRFRTENKIIGVKNTFLQCVEATQKYKMNAGRNDDVFCIIRNNFWNSKTLRKFNEIYMRMFYGSDVAQTRELIDREKCNIKLRFDTSSRIFIYEHMSGLLNDVKRISLPVAETYEMLEGRNVINDSKQRREKTHLQDHKLNDDIKSSKTRYHGIKLLPNPDQERVIIRWFNTSRWLYNRTIDKLIQLQQEYPDGIPSTKLEELRNKLMEPATYDNEKEKWVLYTLHEIRYQAVEKAINLLIQNINNKSFSIELQFQQRHISTVEYIKVTAPALQQIRVMSRGSSGKNLWEIAYIDCKQGRKIPARLCGDALLSLDSCGIITLHVPLLNEPVIQHIYNRPLCAAVALIQDNEHFLIGKDPNNYTLHTSHLITSRLKKLMATYKSKLVNLSENENDDRDYLINQACLQNIQHQINSNILKLHTQVAKWLCHNYKCIAFSHIHKSANISTGQNFSTKTTSQMWNYDGFLSTLLQEAQHTPGCIILCSLADVDSLFPKSIGTENKFPSLVPTNATHMGDNTFSSINTQPHTFRCAKSYILYYLLKKCYYNSPYILY